MANFKFLKHKTITLFKSERTLGAKKVLSKYATKSYQQMQTSIIQEYDVDSMHLKDKARIKNLVEHLNKVKYEFVGQPELNFYMATLIILLRRDYNTKDVYSKFQDLWQSECDFLLKHLNLRWVISACDTFVDHSSSPTRSAILMNATSLVNTLKVYETFEFLTAHSDTIELNQSNVNSLYANHLPLYDGLTLFRIGSDDTLKHMRQRYQNFKHHDPLATTILLHVFDQINDCSNALQTLKALHQDEKSQWF